MTSNQQIVAWCTSGVVHLTMMVALALATKGGLLETGSLDGGIVLEATYVPEDAVRDELHRCICPAEPVEEPPPEPPPRPDIYRHEHQQDEMPPVPQPVTPQALPEARHAVPELAATEFERRDPHATAQDASAVPRSSAAVARVSKLLPAAAVRVAVPLREQSTANTAGVAVDQLPRKLQTNPPPAYPAGAFARRQQGRVLLEVKINGRGLVEDVSVSKSSGFPALDQAALETVRDWRFEPARRRGVPVSMVVTVPIRFSIQDR